MPKVNAIHPFAPLNVDRLGNAYAPSLTRSGVAASGDGCYVAWIARGKCIRILDWKKSQRYHRSGEDIDEHEAVQRYLDEVSHRSILCKKEESWEWTQKCVCVRLYVTNSFSYFPFSPRRQPLNATRLSWALASGNSTADAGAPARVLSMKTFTRFWTFPRSRVSRHSHLSSQVFWCLSLNENHHLNSFQATKTMPTVFHIVETCFRPKKKVWLIDWLMDFSWGRMIVW